MAHKDGYVYVHRLKAEEKLGRKLKHGECVHHIDGDKLNNDIDNLMIFKTTADHTAFHDGCEIHLDNDVYVADFGTIINKNGKRMKKCPICGGLMTKSASCCVDCRKIKSRKVSRPDKDTLLKLISTYSFVTIGKRYGVTDNAVRKWCKFYNLPYKHEDIKKINM